MSGGGRGYCCLGIDTTWLLTGEGPMRREADCALHDATGVAADGPDYIQVPRYDVAAGAEGGVTIHSEQIVDHLSFKQAWLRTALGVSSHHVVLISALGDSMEPTIKPGDLLLIDRQMAHGLGDGLYVIGLDDRLLAKRLQRRADGSLLINSDNAAYAPETLTPSQTEDLRVIGKEVWAGRKVA